MKAVILARVSSKDQQEGYSIAAQKRRLLEYCDRRAFDVIEIFEIVESSTRGDRKLFRQMLDFIKKRPHPVALVADKVDRVQRSFQEFPMLDDLIQRGQLELHFNTEGYVITRESKSQDRLMWSIGVVMSQAYVENLRDNVKRGMEQKVRNGEWTSAPPTGYALERQPNGRNWIVPDPVHGVLVGKVFERYATGLYSLSEMADYSESIGLRSRSGKTLTAPAIHNLIKNPFYCGEMIVKGKIWPHRYAPLTDKATFQACYDVRRRKSNWQQPVVYRGKDFLFRSLMRCAVSGKTITCDIKREKYVYLICHDPYNPAAKLYIPEEEIALQVKEVLNRLHISYDVLEAMRARLALTHESEKRFHHDAIRRLEREKGMIQARTDKLLDLFLDGGIGQEDYNKKAADIRERKIQVMAEIEQHEKADDCFKDAATMLFELTSSAAFTFENSNTEQKREMMGLLFSNMQLRGKKLEYTMHQPFDLMLDIRTVKDGGRYLIRTGDLYDVNVAL